MMVKILCHYCGMDWTCNLYSKSAVGSLKCLRCGDKNLKLIDLDRTKIDYYAGSPPFPDEEKEEDSVLDYDTYL